MALTHLVFLLLTLSLSTSFLPPLPHTTSPTSLRPSTPFLSRSPPLSALPHSPANAAPIAFFGAILKGKTPSVFFMLGVAGVLYKFFSTKNPTKEDAPNWKYVVTDESEETDLKAFSCNECGYTIFPARGREGKFFPSDYKCAMCGAGREAFEDKRDEIREDVGETSTDQVVYEKKDDYAEKRENTNVSAQVQSISLTPDEEALERDIEAEISKSPSKSPAAAKKSGGDDDLSILGL